MKSGENILFIGRPENAMLSPLPKNRGITVCKNPLQGLEKSLEGGFTKIFVLFNSIESPGRFLASLRENNPSSRIILAVQMIEEPLAIGLMEQSRNGSALADDYLLCPLNPRELLPEDSAPAAAAAVDTGELERRIRELEILATQDDLTGLKNRRYLNQFLDQILVLAKTHPFNITLLLLDIDDFKHYNDRYGHRIGDNVLIQAAKMIQRCCRSHDIVARIGGDEFAVLFWDLPEKKAASRSAERRRAKGKHPREPLFMAERFQRELGDADLTLLGDRGKGKLTLSGGLASYGEDAKNAEELFEKADQMLLQAKREGKNRILIVGKPPK